MGEYFEGDDPAGPWCACGMLCSGGEAPIGWCVECEDWASRFGDPVIDPNTDREHRSLLVYDPARSDFFEWDPVNDRWEGSS